MKAALTLLALLLTITAVTAAPKPNILVIVADDLGYADLGVHGGKDVPTPNLDALAASGMRYTSGYVTSPYCSPSRAGFLTGRYQTRFGHEFNPHVGEGERKKGREKKGDIHMIDLFFVPGGRGIGVTRGAAGGTPGMASRARTGEV